MEDALTPKYRVGQTVHHRVLGYHAVVVAADPDFRGSPSWYDLVALTRPAKNRPWYRIRPTGSSRTLYVPEADLTALSEAATTLGSAQEVPASETRRGSTAPKRDGSASSAIPSRQEPPVRI